MRKHIIPIVLGFLLLGGCKSPNNILSGVYCTSPKTNLESVLLQHKLGIKVGSMWVLSLHLRNDNTYILGTCDCQILEAGNYYLKNDSIALHNRYSFKIDNKIPSQSYFFDKKEEELYFVSPIKNSKKFSHKLSVLKKNTFDHHFGFLRNQNWSLDSLYRHNTYYSLDKQHHWLDSTLKTMQ